MSYPVLLYFSYAIFLQGIPHPHSHSIISNDASPLICKHNFSDLTDKCRRYIRLNSSVLNSQNNLCRSEYWRYRYLSVSINWIALHAWRKSPLLVPARRRFTYRQRLGKRWFGHPMVPTPLTPYCALSKQVRFCAKSPPA